jgi:hypothetical protein
MFGRNKMCECNCCCKKKYFNIHIRTRVNDGPFTPAIHLRIEDGDEIVICQPVEVIFKTKGSPILEDYRST